MKKLHVPAKPTPSIWERIAGRSIKDRQAAEELHRFLQTAVTGRNVLIDDLIALVRQLTRALSTVAMQYHSLHSRVFLLPSDELFYAMYVHELDGVYAQAVRVFKDCGMGSSEDSVAFHRATTTALGTSTVELGWQSVFPFGFRKTCDSMWMSVSMIHQQDSREVFDDVKDPENTSAVKFRFSKTVEGGGCESLVLRCVKRRFVGEDREIGVWKSSIQGDGSFRGLHIEETGWTAFRHSANGSGTFVQTSIRQVPLHLNGAKKATQDLAIQFDGFVQTMVDENYHELTKMVVSLLLDEVLDKITI